MSSALLTNENDLRDFHSVKWTEGFFYHMPTIDALHFERQSSLMIYVERVKNKVNQCFFYNRVQAHSSKLPMILEVNTLTAVGKKLVLYFCVVSLTGYKLTFKCSPNQ